MLLRLEINAQAGMPPSARSDSADLNALLHRLGLLAILPDAVLS